MNDKEHIVDLRIKLSQALNDRQRLADELNKTEWVSVSKSLPPLEKKVLLYWRPINHKMNPRAKTIIIGELSMYGPDNYINIDDPRYVWTNGMYCEVETHITHWRYLPQPPNNKEQDNG